MRRSAPSVAARIKALIARIETESDPAAPSCVVPAEDTLVDDGGQYGDPFTASLRPEFLQKVYDDLPDMKPMGE